MARRKSKATSKSSTRKASPTASAAASASRSDDVDILSRSPSAMARTRTSPLTLPVRPSICLRPCPNPPFSHCLDWVFAAHPCNYFTRAVGRFAVSTLSNVPGHLNKWLKISTLDGTRTMCCFGTLFAPFLRGRSLGIGGKCGPFCQILGAAASLPAVSLGRDRRNGIPRLHLDSPKLPIPRGSASRYLRRDGWQPHRLYVCRQRSGSLPRHA